MHFLHFSLNKLKHYYYIYPLLNSNIFRLNNLSIILITINFNKMKKFYFLALFAFAAFTINAQVNVVFSVDMNDASVADGDIVTIGGDFQGWMPGAETFADDNENGVYSYTYTTDAGIMPGQEILCKFVINDWGTNEFGDNMQFEDCTNVEGNRIFTIPADAEGTYVLPTFIYNTCQISTLSVNTNDISTIEGVKFTPNPATDRTLISFENPANETHNIVVTSMTGQVVSTLTTTGNSAELSVADFATGMYFVTFRNEAGEQGTEKLIVR